MTISPGVRLGPYEILSPLGAGGMGEVYRARDPRLQRDVAIKVLPAGFSSDPDRLRRFEQEARAAGLLNHPNITAVYDVGQHEGAPYVVQELLDGETLRAELASGSLSLRQAIDSAVQIAQGLSAAHEKGIVHRDLKPENVFVKKDGRIKILDFGLAKLVLPEPEGSQKTNLPTASAGTEPGVVLGTLGYMSPEQVRGRSADARSDIFAFGAILYEMLSGRRAFRGESAADTMSAILKEDPPELTASNRSVSPALERIVRHCLEKNPERRFQSASDLAFDLESLSGVSGSGAALSAPAPRRRLFWPVAALLGVLGGLAAGAILAMRFGKSTPPTYRQLTFRRGAFDAARFGPDGQTIVYSMAADGGPSRVYTLRPGAPESSLLNLPAARLESVSRSGELALVLRGTGDEETGTLSRSPLSGGSPREVLADVNWADWSPDGKELAVAHVVKGKVRLEYPIGRVLFEPEDRVGCLRVSPTGDRVAFIHYPLPQETGGSVMVVDRQGKSRTLSSGWFDLGWLAWRTDGREVWFSASRSGSRRSVWAVDLSGRERLVADAPGNVNLRDLSAAGQAVVGQGTWRAYITGLPPGESAERDLSWLDFTFPIDLSDDGKTLLFQEWGEGGGAKGGVYLRRMDEAAPVRLGEGFALSLSPDGKWVLARLYATPPSLVLLPTGPGSLRPLSTPGLVPSWGAFLPDGKRMVFFGSGAKGATGLYLAGIEGEAPRLVTPILEPGPIGRGPISPDGKRLAWMGRDMRAVLVSLDGGAQTPVAGAENGERPVRWSPDGKWLYVSRSDGTRLVVSRVDPLSGRREAWKELTITSDPAGLRPEVIPFLLSTDGKSYVLGYQRWLTELYLVDGLK